MADIAAAGPPMATATQRTALANHSLSTAPAATTTKADDPIYSAKDLVEAFKSSGAFDAIRADLMKAYLASDGGSKFERDIENNIGEVIARMYQKKTGDTNGHHRRNSSLDGPGNTSRESIKSATTASPSAANRLKSLQSTHGDKRQDLDYVITQLDRQPAYDRAQEGISKLINTQHGKTIHTQLESILKIRGRGTREDVSELSFERERADSNAKSEGPSALRHESRLAQQYNRNASLLPHHSLPMRPDFKAVHRNEPADYRALDAIHKSADETAWK